MSTPTVSTAPVTSTIDYLIANLPHPEIVRLLQARDPNAIRLLRMVNGNSELTLTVTKAVTEELGLTVHDDETAVKVLNEIKDHLSGKNQDSLRKTVDDLIKFAEADIDDEVDLEAISDPFALFTALQGNARLLVLCEEVVAYLLQTIVPLTDEEQRQ